MSGKAGQVHDFGTITLIDASGHIAGRVVDSGGKPLAEVAVFNRGDGPKPALTQTDATGQFRLEGLYPGTKFVFARKDGFRFTGVKIEQDAADLTIRLLRTDEPPPAWKPGATASYEEQRAFARRALTQIWERFSKGPDIGRSGAFVCILDMAQIDPALALRWSAEHGHRYDGRVRQAAGEALADTDAKEALELLAQDPARDTQNTLQQLAERFSETDREKSLLFAEEAAVQARALEQPDRARAMAQAGAVLTKLGRGAAGRKLIDEATDTARRLGTEGMQGYTRAAVAQAVAPFDVKLALELIEPLKEPNDKDRYAGFVATGVAATDPARAVALADAMAGNSYTPEDVKTEVAYRIGGDRPEEAIKIIEGMKGYSADKARAEAFGWLAVAVAHHDRPRAFALIDRALSYPVNHPEAFQSWVYFGGGTASAGLIAANARRIGYPDMESVVMRVLASRPTGRGSFDDPAMQTQSATIAASILALTDPGAGARAAPPDRASKRVQPGRSQQGRRPPLAPGMGPCRPETCRSPFSGRARRADCSE